MKPGRRRGKGKHSDRGSSSSSTPVKDEGGNETGVEIGNNNTIATTKHGKNGNEGGKNIVILKRNNHHHHYKNICQGIILMEPAHTSLSNTPTNIPTAALNTNNTNQTKSPGGGGGRWAVDVPDNNTKGKKGSGSQMIEEGLILLLSDPLGLFSNDKKKKGVKGAEVEELESEMSELLSGREGGGQVEDGDRKLASPPQPALNESQDKGNQSMRTNHIHIKFRSVGVSAVRIGGGGGGGTPRRGDLVSFVKGKGGSYPIAKDIRLLNRSFATTKRGRLINISLEDGMATLVVDDSSNYNHRKSKKREHRYPFDLSEMISCDCKLLKENTNVEGILHGSKIYGACRTTDLYLTSKIGIGKKGRPRLNLTVKKELQGMGGRIVAQSGLAKGPDDTIGFAQGWTKRSSRFSTSITMDSVDEDESGNNTKKDEKAANEKSCHLGKNEETIA